MLKFSILNVGHTFMLFKNNEPNKTRAWLESCDCKYLHVPQLETVAINIFHISILICDFSLHRSMHCFVSDNGSVHIGVLNMSNV